MEGTINDRYKKLRDGHVRAAHNKARWTAALFGFADSASLGCQALVFWYGGRLLPSGEYTMEAFFVCFMAAIQGAEAVSQSLAVAPSAAQATAAANRILDIHESADRDRRDSVLYICEPLQLCARPGASAPHHRRYHGHRRPYEILKKKKDGGSFSNSMKLRCQVPGARCKFLPGYSSTPFAAANISIMN